MQISGRWEPRHSTGLVWDVLTDPEVLARHTPGCERLEPTGEDTYRMDLKLAVAGIGGSYQATLQAVDVQRPSHYGLRVQGRGPVGAIQVTGAFELAPQGESTVVDYAWDITLAGPMAGVAGRVLGGVARMMLDKFFQDLDQELTLRASARNSA